MDNVIQFPTPNIDDALRREGIEHMAEELKNLREKNTEAVKVLAQRGFTVDPMIMVIMRLDSLLKFVFPAECDQLDFEIQFESNVAETLGRLLKESLTSGRLVIPK